MGATASLPMCAVKSVPSKGKELIATKHISKGTRIISENPIVISGRHVANIVQLQNRISQQVSSLSEEQQQEFLTMHNIYPYINSAERYRGIF